MKTFPAQEIKRRGISAVDDALEGGEVHIIQHNRPRYVILSEARYQELIDRAGQKGKTIRLIDDLETLKKKVLPVLLPHGVERVALFGSAARGEESPDSDIDLLVRLAPSHKRPPLGLKWFGLAGELSRLLGRTVDLVSEEALSPYIRPFVEKEKITLYEK